MNLRRCLTVLFALGALSACQTAPTRSAAGSGLLDKGGVPTELGPSSTTVIDSNKTTDERIVDFKDIPKEYQDLVMQWVGYFQGRGRGHMERYLSRSTRYIPMMKTILRQSELPEDLVYVCLIESGFSPKAFSRAGASGYWQFIRATGKSYGLTNNRLMDERRDPELSTAAAGQYFKGLYNLFGSWPLAIAAYNVGENRIKRVVMKKHTRDLWELISLKQLPRETANYVPKFIAAEMIAREPRKFGFSDIAYEPAMTFDRVTSTRPVDLKRFAENIDLDYEEMKRLNPKYKTTLAPLEQGQVVLRVPKASKENALAALEKSYATEKELRVAGRENSAPSNRYYKVHRGDTVESVASRFKISVGELTRSARVRASRPLKVGSYLKLPTSFEMDAGDLSKLSRRPSAATSKVSKIVKRATGVHVVRRGDTLIGIAKRYDVPVPRIVSANNLSRHTMLNVGRKLVIPD